MYTPRVIESPSGRIEVLQGVSVTADWEGNPDVTEYQIYVGNAPQPSVIVRPAHRDSPRARQIKSCSE